ncbi:MAG: hypothetical protein RLZZ436_4079 [Planctomycetota bacterium]|jgi:hypothetical protein
MNVQEILETQRHCTEHWHQAAPEAIGDGLLKLVQQNHLENFSLWHEEDIARRDDLGAERIRLAKRTIDRHNQRRNDIVEQMDRLLVQQLQPRESGCSFNSETPGMMIDRLSILALKEYHMQEEVLRMDATVEHRDRCSTKLTTIRRQIQDLAAALQELVMQVQQGTRSFRVYFQFKMYNDAELNPQLRKAA